MKITIEQFGSLETDTQIQIAETVAFYTQGGASEELQMLPVDSNKVLNKYLSYVALDVTESEPAFAGFIAAAQPKEHKDRKLSEVGTLYVPSEYRKQGIATSLLQTITKALELQTITPFAFVNPTSRPIFTSEGYVPANTDQLFKGVFSPCQSCPKLPINGGCCDKQVIKELNYESISNN